MYTYKGYQQYYTTTCTCSNCFILALVVLFCLLITTTGSTRQKRQTMSYVGTHTVCRLVVVADYYFYQNLGQNDRRTTGEYIVSHSSFILSEIYLL